MKFHLFFLVFLALLLASCGNDRNDPQYQQYVEDTQRAEQLAASRDSTINDLFGTLNRISDNLQTIRAKQGQLSTDERGVENGENMEQRIMRDLQAIDSLIAENRSLMERLQANAGVSAAGITELQRTLTDLERSINEKDAEIAGIKEELMSSNSSLATLIEMYRDKVQLTDIQREELNTAYYAVGTMKELRANGILTREGGVAGIGGVNKLDVAHMPQSYFKRVDVSTDLEIPVVAKKASIVTPHPEGSYRFENGAEKLVITDAAQFWSISKYLVVVAE